MEPPASSDRIVALDILRGIALFGMILVHFHQRMEIPTEGVEDLVGWIIWMGVETKAWATFAFLFGASFAIIMRRAETSGRRVVPLFLRRMLVLAVFGFLLQTLLGFRILIEYAIWGVALLFVRNWSTKALLILALFSALAGTIYGVTRSAIEISRVGSEQAQLDRTARMKKFAQPWVAISAAEKSGSYTEAVKARAKGVQLTYLRWQTLIPGADFVLFIIGLLAVRHGIFEEPRRKLKPIVVAMVFGLASWACAWWVLPKLPTDTAIRGVAIPLRYGFGIVSDQWLAFTYVGLAVLLLAYAPVWKQRLSIFGTAGRMALTNYVLQAAVISLLSASYGFGLQIRPYFVPLSAVALFSVLALVSKWWLARYNYGPLEWIWRSATYAKWQQNVKAPVMDPALAA